MNRAVSVDNAELLRLGDVIEGIQKGVEGARIAKTKIVHHVVAEGVNFSGGRAARMILVAARTEAGRQRAQPRSQIEHVLTVAIARKNAVLWCHDVVQLEVEIVELTDVAPHCTEIVKDPGQVRLGK